MVHKKSPCSRGYKIKQHSRPEVLLRARERRHFHTYTFKSSLHNHTHFKNLKQYSQNILAYLYTKPKPKKKTPTYMNLIHAAGRASISRWMEKKPNILYINCLSLSFSCMCTKLCICVEEFFQRHFLYTFLKTEVKCAREYRSSKRIFYCSLFAV